MQLPASEPPSRWVWPNTAQPSSRQAGALPEWVVDVTDRPSVDALRDKILDRYGRLDILVNAAGYTFRQPTRTVCERQWADLLDTDLTGSLRTCQAFHTALKASGKGRVVNIASLGSFVAFQEVAAYCAAKTGLLSLTRSLAVEWARDGICVNAIAPGIVSDRDDGSAHHGYAARQRTAAAHADGAFWQA